MIPFLAAFFILFAGAAGALWLLPSAPTAIHPHSAEALQLDANAQPKAERPQVRVVYPASGADASRAAAPVSAVADATPAPAPTAQISAPSVAAIYPQVHDVGLPAAEPATPVNATAQAGTQNININTASIEMLNGIPGAGRIGRTIASHRPYRSVEDLLTKRVVRKDVYERIKAQIAAE